MQQKNISILQGFTLIELLVAILIIGILAAVALPQYQVAVMKSRLATLKANTEALYQAEQLYYLANGTYSSNMEELDLSPSGCTLSETKTQCIISDGSCGLDTSNQRVSCQNQYLRYSRYFGGSNQGLAGCWAFTTDTHDIYNRVCQLDGAIFHRYSGCNSTTCSLYLYN